MCALDGLVVNIPGGEGNPGPYPWNWWPDPPGFPDPEPLNWPEPPGGGTWPDLPPPEPGDCDPNGFMDPCEWTATLSCTTGVIRGGTAECKLEVEPSMIQVQVIVWTFKADPPHDQLNVYRPSSSTTWTGTAAVSGRVRVDFQAGGRDATVQSEIQVLPRSWSWGTSHRTFQQGVPPDLDNCMTGGAGLTADVFGCTAAAPWILINPGPGQGFTISEGSGPNEGIWYVTNPTTRMDLRTQLARRYRPDGLTFPLSGIPQVVQACQAAYSPNPVPPQNDHTVNTACFQTTGFTNLVNFTWNHEADHLALAQQEAGQPQHDIYQDWEGIVRGTYSDAFDAADDVQEDMHLAVRQAALQSHTGGSTSFNLWYHLGSGTWDWATVTVLH